MTVKFNVVKHIYEQSIRTAHHIRTGTYVRVKPIQIHQEDVAKHAIQQPDRAVFIRRHYTAPPKHSNKFIG